MPLQRGQAGRDHLAEDRLADLADLAGAAAPEHVVADVPGLAPVALHVAHGTGTRTRISFDVPKTAERKSMSTVTSMSAPRGGPACPRPRAWPKPPAPPPKKLLKRSPRPAPNRSSKPPAPLAAGAGAPQALGPERVVATPALGVAQRLVGQRHQLEAFLGLGVAGVGVGVQLAGELPVGPLDLVLVGAARDGEQLVEIREVGGHGLASRRWRPRRALTMATAAMAWG